jgi:hypothetical protein
MGDSIYDKMAKVSASEIAESLEGKTRLSAQQLAAADIDGDGKVDEKDVELLAQAQLKLANKISGAIIGMDELTAEEKKAGERNGDGHLNLTDGHRLADDARKARSATARLKNQKK